MVCRVVQADSPRFEQMATSGLRDLQATLSVVKADSKELKKINRDFSMAYLLKDVVMRYKEPNKLRMEGRVGKEPGLFIVNGAARFFRVAGIKHRDTLGEAPGRRHSLMDVGLISRHYLTVAQGEFLRDETLDGTQTHVFKVTCRGDDSAHSLLWIDPRTRVIAKREWYDGAGKLRAVFYFKNVQEVQPGLWLPTRMEVQNSEGVVAGITAYSDLKVNQGLEDSVFEIS